MRQRWRFGDRTKEALCALLLEAIFLSALAMAQELPTARAQFLNSTIDLAEVVPQVSSLEQSPQTNLVARVTANTYWQLAIVREASARLPDSFAEEVAASVDGTWFPLTPGMAIPVASGQRTPAEGVVVTTPIRVTTTFDMAPGRRQYNLAAVVNGKRADAAVRLQYRIPPTITVANENGQFAITADRPSEVRDYDFTPQTYLVRSNAPWVFDIVSRPSLGAAPDSKPFAIEALDVKGKYRLLTESVTVALGPPTGQAGKPVLVQLRVRLAEAPAAGTYASHVETRARLLEPEN